jgi:Nucleotidyltransferase domain
VEEIRVFKMGITSIWSALMLYNPSMVSTVQRHNQLPLTTDQLREIARVVGHAVGASKVVLFGSAARGTTHAWSDLDWMLVMPDAVFGSGFLEQSKPALLAAQVLEDAGLYVCPMEFVPVRESSFNAGSHTLARVAAIEGLVLYEA